VLFVVTISMMNRAVVEQGGHWRGGWRGPVARCGSPLHL